MMKGQLAGLMKQAQAMQENLKKAQDELATIEVEGQSGAGLVKVTMTCKHDVRRVTIENLRWGDVDRSLAILRGRSKYKHVHRMLSEIRSRYAELKRPVGTVAIAVTVPATQPIARWGAPVSVSAERATTMPFRSQR